MKNKKAAKIIKIVAITLASVVAVSVAGFFVTVNFVIKPKSKEIIKAVDEIIQDDDIKKAIEPYLQQNQLNDIMKSIDESKTVSEGSGQASDKASDESQSDSADNKADAKSDAKDNTSSNNGSNAAQSTSGENKSSKANSVGGQSGNTSGTTKKNRSQYSSQYDYVKDNVPASDFARGMSLVSRVDMGYVSGLLAGGLTPAERSELKSYLTSRFSGSEIAEGIALYSKYSYLLR